MYQSKDKQREYDRERKRKSRTKPADQGENVLPDTKNVLPNVLPYQDVVPEGDTAPIAHPDVIQCGVITYQWQDAPAWLQRSYMGSTRKWERMLCCIPDYTRPACLTGGGTGGRGHGWKGGIGFIAL